MSVLIKILIITLCMNIALALTGISLGGSDVLQKFVSVNNETITPSSSFSLASNDSSIPTTMSSGSITSGSLGYFLDSLALVFKFLLLILVTLFLPIYWAFALSLPLWVAFLLLVETIVGVVSVIMVIRGVSP